MRTRNFAYLARGPLLWNIFLQISTDRNIISSNKYTEGLKDYVYHGLYFIITKRHLIDLQKLDTFFQKRAFENVALQKVVILFRS